MGAERIELPNGGLSVEPTETEEPKGSTLEPPSLPLAYAPSIIIEIVYF